MFVSVSTAHPKHITDCACNVTARIVKLMSLHQLTAYIVPIAVTVFRLSDQRSKVEVACDDCYVCVNGLSVKVQCLFVG